jgi:predicted DNA-binding transcriptional regulator AlpA
MARVKKKNAPEVPLVSNINSEGYETADQIALRLHVQRSTIYDWTARELNPLPSKRITNKVTLFLWSDVQAWVEAGGTLRRKRAA